MRTVVVADAPPAEMVNVAERAFASARLAVFVNLRAVVTDPSAPEVARPEATVLPARLTVNRRTVPAVAPGTRTF